MAKRKLSAWECDSDEDYYAQFDESEEDEPDFDDGGGEINDRDCEYWASNCYGRA